MLKTLAPLAIGIFVGAVVMEIIGKKFPDARDRIHARLRDIGSRMKAALKEGYGAAPEPQEAAAPSA